MADFMDQELTRIAELERAKAHTNKEDHNGARDKRHRRDLPSSSNDNDEGTP